MENKRIINRDITVWLDLDDTVWDFRGNSRKSLADLYSLRNLDRWFGTVDEWIECYERHNHALWDLYNRGEIAKEFLMTERFRRPLTERHCDDATAREMGAELDTHYLDLLGQCGTLIDGARELLQWLRDNGCTTGILSNGFVEVQHRKLRSAGIDGMIDCVVLSDEIGVNKPARELFDYAAVKSGNPDGRHIMIGDNPLTDIAGAVNAGWDAIYFNRDGSGTPLPPELSATIPQITQLNSAPALLADLA